MPGRTRHRPRARTISRRRTVNFEILPNDLAELTMIGSYQGETILNVFHYQYYNTVNQPDGVAELSNLMTRFDADVWGFPLLGIRQRLTNGYTLNTLKAQIVHPTRRFYKSQVPTESAGAIQGGGIPSNTNITITQRTTGAFRGAAGNKKFTALPLTTVNGNVFSAPTVSEWNATCAVLLNTFACLNPPGVWVPVVWSPKRPTERRGILEIYPNEEVRVLRLRQKGVGI